MALTASITFGAVATGGASYVITDITTYGGANPARNTVGVFLTAYKVNEDLDETAMTVASFLPASAATFTITIPTTDDNGDGWHKIYFIICDKWLIGTTYDQYDVVFDSVGLKFYQYINVASSAGHLVSNTSYWSELTDPTSVIADVGTSEEPGNIVYTVTSKIIDYQTAKCFSTLVTGNARENCGEDCDCDPNSKLAKTLRKVRGLLTAMRIDDTQQLYLAGERAARLAENYCDDCGCSL